MLFYKDPFRKPSGFENFLNIIKFVAILGIVGVVLIELWPIIRALVSFIVAMLNQLTRSFLKAQKRN